MSLIISKVCCNFPVAYQFGKLISLIFISGKAVADHRAREPVQKRNHALIPKPGGQHHRSTQKGGYSLRAALGLDCNASKAKYDALLVRLLPILVIL